MTDKVKPQLEGTGLEEPSDAESDSEDDDPSYSTADGTSSDSADASSSSRKCDGGDDSGRDGVGEDGSKVQHESSSNHGSDAEGHQECSHSGSDNGIECIDGVTDGVSESICEDDRDFVDLCHGRVPGMQSEQQGCEVEADADSDCADVDGSDLDMADPKPCPGRDDKVNNQNEVHVCMHHNLLCCTTCSHLVASTSHILISRSV